MVMFMAWIGLDWIGLDLGGKINRVGRVGMSPSEC